MIKSRLFVVDSNTIKKAKKTNIASINIPDLKGAFWMKTIADIMTDMLQIEIGDYIFFWEIKSINQKSRIHGIYRAISKSYFSFDDEFDNTPFKIHIEKAYDLENTIAEYDFMNCPYIKDNLWTVVGKKVAGKSRGTSLLSIEETKHLITLLIGANPNCVFIPQDNSRVVSANQPLKIDYNNKEENIKSADFLKIDSNSLIFINKSNDVQYEKILGTIFNYEMSDRNPAFFQQLDIDVNKVIWFSNYLPYSIEQSEMNYVIIESEDNYFLSKIYLIEFIKNKLDKSHIKRSFLYSKWTNDTLTLGVSIVQPIIICENSIDFINEEQINKNKEKLAELNEYCTNLEIEYRVKKLKVYTYDFSNNSPTFT